MKNYIYSFFALLLISSQYVFSAGYLATYSFQVSNPTAYIEAVDELMATEWGKSFPSVVAVHQYAFNGYDDATHVVVLNYDDPESVGSGTESFNDPIFQSFLAKTASIAKPVEQTLNMKLISGGNEDPLKNQVYTIYRMQVKDPGLYAAAYSDVIEAQTEAGNIVGSYGLRQLVGGDSRYYTHYAYFSAGSIGEQLSSSEALFSSDSYATFAEEVGENRRIMNVSTLVNLVTYNN